jgi:hypothetical protein
MPPVTDAPQLPLRGLQVKRGSAGFPAIGIGGFGFNGLNLGKFLVLKPVITDIILQPV